MRGPARDSHTSHTAPMRHKEASLYSNFSLHNCANTNVESLRWMAHGVLINFNTPRSVPNNRKPQAVSQRLKPLAPHAVGKTSHNVWHVWDLTSSHNA